MLKFLLGCKSANVSLFSWPDNLTLDDAITAFITIDNVDYKIIGVSNFTNLTQINGDPVSITFTLDSETLPTVTYKFKLLDISNGILLCKISSGDSNPLPTEPIDIVLGAF